MKSPNTYALQSRDIPSTMKAVVTTGNGGYEKLEYKDVPVPALSTNQVLVQVLAAGINNTEINTRLGWYSKSVTTGTLETSDESTRTGPKNQPSYNQPSYNQHANSTPNNTPPTNRPDGGWNKPTPFPLIQGTDCCGRVVAAGSTDHSHLLDRRVLIRPCIRAGSWESYENIWMASDFDGAFAQFVSIPASEVFPVRSTWSNTELGTIPCAYGTAENMIHRAGVRAGQRVLITGASGGVGSAAVQLVKRRGAHCIAITQREKAEQISQLGADQVLDRSKSVVQALGEKSIHVAIDNVGGTGVGDILKVLSQGGRYVSSGAIAGPMLSIDIRDVYLKDVSIIGCTAWDEPVFPNLISYIEQGEIRPLVAGTFPLSEIIQAQKTFLQKTHVGKFVLVPEEL